MLLLTLIVVFVLLTFVINKYSKVIHSQESGKNISAIIIKDALTIEQPAVPSIRQDKDDGNVLHTRQDNRNGNDSTGQDNRNGNDSTGQDNGNGNDSTGQDNGNGNDSTAQDNGNGNDSTGQDNGNGNDSKGQDNEEVIEKQVLVLFSYGHSQDVQCVLENVVKALHQYDGIHPVFFQKSCVNGSVADWVTDNIKNSSKVLLVCNEQFAMEWTQVAVDNLFENSVVYILHQIIDCYVKHDKRELDKFAVLYLRKADQKCLDDPFIRNMKSFLVNPQDVTYLEEVVEFIHDQQHFQLQS